jgi:GNAT superfamily N-acetyltransferase
VRIDTTTTLTAPDLEALRAFDSSFTTDTIYRVDANDAGFTLVEERLGTPLRKRYALDDRVVGLEHPWDTMLFARSDDGLAGFAATSYQEWNRRQSLDELHVRAAWRGQGLARQLLEMVRDEARRNGAREIHVETQNVNRPGVRAYGRLGFTLTGIDMTLYSGLDEVALYLSAAL